MEEGDGKRKAMEEEGEEQVAKSEENQERGEHAASDANVPLPQPVERKEETGASLPPAVEAECTAEIAALSSTPVNDDQHSSSSKKEGGSRSGSRGTPEVPEWVNDPSSTYISKEETNTFREFFCGRPVKTPEKYVSIRRFILEQWNKVKPTYLKRSMITSQLRGDVNSIGHVYAYLEKRGYINANATISPPPAKRPNSSGGGSSARASSAASSSGGASKSSVRAVSPTIGDAHNSSGNVDMDSAAAAAAGRDSAGGGDVGDGMEIDQEIAGGGDGGRVSSRNSNARLHMNGSNHNNNGEHKNGNGSRGDGAAAAGASNGGVGPSSSTPASTTSGPGQNGASAAATAASGRDTTQQQHHARSNHREHHRDDFRGNVRVLKRKRNAMRQEALAAKDIDGQNKDAYTGGYLSLVVPPSKREQQLRILELLRQRHTKKRINPTAHIPAAAEAAGGGGEGGGASGGQDANEGVSVRISSIEHASLRRYRRYFRLPVDANAPRQQLASAVRDHFKTLQIPKDDVVVNAFVRFVTKKQK